MTGHRGAAERHARVPVIGIVRISCSKPRCSQGERLPESNVHISRVVLRYAYSKSTQTWRSHPFESVRLQCMALGRFNDNRHGEWLSKDWRYISVPARCSQTVNVLLGSLRPRGVACMLPCAAQDCHCKRLPYTATSLGERCDFAYAEEIVAR